MESAVLEPEAPSAVCQRHPQQPALAACQRCGDYVCRECETRRRFVVFCPVCAPPAEAPVASAWSRFAGHFLDHTLLLFPPAFAGFYASKKPEDLADTIITIGASVLALVVAANVATLRLRGQSLGKLVMGTRLVTMNYERVPMWRVLVRGMVQGVGMVVGLINIISGLMVVAGDTKRTLHDLAAGTRVVRAAESAHLYGRTSPALPLT
jgi:uncharacterized RDD family membrane protein YckC